MVDYAKLADKAKAIEDAVRYGRPQPTEQKVNANVFFQRVTELIGEEMDKANVELRKRGIDTIARNYLPTFDGVIFLVSGTARLCRIELERKAGIPQVKAVISGPPNGNEISRKVFVVGQERPNSVLLDAESETSPVVGASPAKIAQEVISAVVIGTFD
jgi:hypothetical protein